MVNQKSDKNDFVPQGDGYPMDDEDWDRLASLQTPPESQHLFPDVDLRFGLWRAYRFFKYCSEQELEALARRIKK